MNVQEFSGIHFMMPTPFAADGSVDHEPIKRLVECATRAGCTGVVTLGVMGEAHRLVDSERAGVIESVVSACQGRLTVTVGVSAQSGMQAATRVIEAQQLGASAAMASPPSLAKPNESAVYSYYEQLDSAATIPLVVQDLPEQTGVHMMPDFIARLNGDLQHAKYLKLEDPPTPPKVSAVKALTNGSMGIFGGMGGAFLFEELRRGACGTMTGFAYPEVLVAVYSMFSEGDTESARQMFYRWLPLIRYENTAGLGLSIRKHLMTKRGLLASPAVRPPTPSIDALGIEELEDILSAMGPIIDSDISEPALRF